MIDLDQFYEGRLVSKKISHFTSVQTLSQRNENVSKFIMVSNSIINSFFSVLTNRKRKGSRHCTFMQLRQLNGNASQSLYVILSYCRLGIFSISLSMFVSY